MARKRGHQVTTDLTTVKGAKARALPLAGVSCNFFPIGWSVAIHADGHHGERVFLGGEQAAWDCYVQLLGASADADGFSIAQARAFAHDYAKAAS